MNPDYVSAEASTAVKLLCKLFVEKVQREQIELASAAAEVDSQRIQEGYLLNIEHGTWVKEKKIEEKLDESIKRSTV